VFALHIVVVHLQLLAKLYFIKIKAIDLGVHLGWRFVLVHAAYLLFPNLRDIVVLGFLLELSAVVAREDVPVGLEFLHIFRLILLFFLITKVVIRQDGLGNVVATGDHSEALVSLGNVSTLDFGVALLLNVLHLREGV